MSTNVSGLVQKLKQGSYRASRVKRVYLDKPTGGQRPLGLPTLADKLVQQSVAQILGNLYEADFLPSSYGYRPPRSAHGAIHSLRLNLQYKGYGYIVEADIKGFFDTVDHNWLMKTLCHGGCAGQIIHPAEHIMAIQAIAHHSVPLGIEQLHHTAIDDV